MLDNREYRRSMLKVTAISGVVYLATLLLGWDAEAIFRSEEKGWWSTFQWMTQLWAFLGFVIGLPILAWMTFKIRVEEKSGLDFWQAMRGYFGDAPLQRGPIIALVGLVMMIAVFLLFPDATISVFGWALALVAAVFASHIGAAIFFVAIISVGAVVILPFFFLRERFFRYLELPEWSKPVLGLLAGAGVWVGVTFLLMGIGKLVE